MSITTQRDQFYLFTVPDDMCPVWCEMFLAGGQHAVGPTPYSEVELALHALKATNPGATVDELCYEADIAQCREWAATMPLEQLPAVTA